jgi:hypothetical protein
MATKLTLAAAVVIGSSVAVAQTAPPRVPEFERQQQALQQQQQLRELDQFNIDSRIRANEEVPAGQRVLFDYGLLFTPSYLSVTDQNHDTHVLRQYDLIGYTRINLDGANEIFLRGRTDYNDYNHGDSFDGFGSRLVNPDLDRGYYRFDLARSLQAYHGQQINGNFVFQGGRDLVYWQNGLVLGEVLDGVIMDFSAGPFTLETIAGVTPTRTVDIDASRPNFDHNTRRGFYGSMLTAEVGKQKPFVYALSQQDYNTDDFADIGGIKTNYQYNSYYLGAGSSGSLTDHLTYALEAAYEGGTTLSNPFKATPAGLVQISQTHDQIRAWAVDARFDYLFNDSHRTRASFEEIVGSGDRDRGNSSETFNGNRRNTRDNAFNSFGLINTGLAFAPNVSNLSVTRIGLATFPLPNYSPVRKLQIGADFLVYNKVNSHAALEERSNDFRYVGLEPDLYVNWAITSDVTLALRYGVFFPDHALLNNEFSRQFFYAGVTFAF